MPAPRNWFIFFDPPAHTKLRALISQALTPRMIANLEPRIRKLSRELLEPALDRGAIGPASAYAVPLPMQVIAGMIGIPPTDWPRYKRWSDIFDITPDPNPRVGFVRGIHFCLGAALSRLEARIALADLAARFQTFELAADRPWEPRKALRVHGPTRLPIRFEADRRGRGPGLNSPGLPGRCKKSGANKLELQCAVGIITLLFRAEYRNLQQILPAMRGTCRPWLGRCTRGRRGTPLPLWAAARPGGSGLCALRTYGNILA